MTDRSPRRKTPSRLACASAGDPLANVFPNLTRLARIATRIRENNGLVRPITPDRDRTRQEVEA